jgi:hypothetical protein
VATSTYVNVGIDVASAARRQLREVKLDIDVNVKEQCFIRRRDTVSSRDDR